MMCRAKEGYELSDIIRDFKKFTSKKIIQNIEDESESRREWLLDMFSKACEHLKRGHEYNPDSYRDWQDGYHGEVLETNKFIYQKLNYIHNNPVKDLIVETPESYMFSSARNYAGLSSMVEVELIPHQLITYS